MFRYMRHNRGGRCVFRSVLCAYQRHQPRSQINRHSLYEKTVIRRGATIGANATIVCGITIGRYALSPQVRLQQRTFRLCNDDGRAGPAKGMDEQHGHVLKRPDGKGVMICPESGLKYKEVEKGVVRCLDLDEETELPAKMSVGMAGYNDMKRKLIR